MGDFNPEERDLYKVMGLDRGASHADIRKAYYKLAVQLHPDKNPGDEAAKERFQALQRVYAVLSDEKKREIYDRTGSLQDSEELSSQSFEDLYEYYRDMFAKVTVDDIVSFELQYRGSDKEQQDLLMYYEKHKGNMNMVFNWLMCSRPNVDSHRFMDAINAAIEEGKAERYRSFERWCKEVEKQPRPENPLAPPTKKDKMGDKKKKKDKASKFGGKRRAEQGSDEEEEGEEGEQGGGDASALVAAIRGRGAQRYGSFVDALEAKYSKGGKKSGTSSRAAGGGGKGSGGGGKAGAKENNDDNGATAGGSKRQRQPRKKKKKGAEGEEGEEEEEGGGKASGGSRKRREPTEEEFAAAAARLGAKKGTGGANRTKGAAA